MSYFLYFAAVWGLSAGIAFSKLTAPFHEWLEKREGASARWLGALLACPMCLGWHFGYLGVVLGLAPGAMTLANCFTLAFAAAGINLVLAVATEKLGS